MTDQTRFHPALFLIQTAHDTIISLRRESGAVRHASSLKHHKVVPLLYCQFGVAASSGLWFRIRRTAECDGQARRPATAGIAHEIKNPLNFVNNFANLSVELLDELKQTTAPAVAALGEDQRAEVDETTELLTGNLQKIAEHGRRADGIVKSMLPVVGPANAAGSISKDERP